jgi:hypothetical protein
MYKRTMTQTETKTEGYVIENLERSEITKIKKMVLGYGKFKKTADLIGMPVTTLRDILHKGYATPDNVHKIRTALFQDVA